MIYSTNRTASLGTLSVPVNESYYGAGAMSFLEEAAQDELSIFESAIKSDIDEVLIGESASELQALNEGFVKTAVDKIKEMMQKFIAWLEAVSRSALAKLTQLLVRDNEKFIKIARKQINKMKNSGKFEYSGKYVSNYDEIKKLQTKGETLSKKCATAMTGPLTKMINETIEEEKEKIEKLTTSDIVDLCVKDTNNGNLKLIEGQLDLLGNLAKELKSLKSNMKRIKGEANKFISDAKKLESNAEGDYEKDRANTAVKMASAYKSIMQKIISLQLSAYKKLAKIARAAIAKAMGATPTNEGVVYIDDETLMDAMIESANYEYDEALEEMSACEKECGDIDSDDDDEDDE